MLYLQKKANEEWIETSDDELYELRNGMSKNKLLTFNEEDLEAIASLNVRETVIKIDELDVKLISTAEAELLYEVQQYQRGYFELCPFCGFAYPELSTSCNEFGCISYQYVCKECGTLGQSKASSNFVRPLKEDLFDAYCAWNSRNGVNSKCY